MKHYLILLIFCSFLKTSIGQSHQEVQFVKHLVESSYFEEAIRELGRINISKYNSNQIDSLHFYKGWSLYSTKKLQASTQSLLRVTYNSKFYAKSRLFSAYNMTHLRLYNNAEKILSTYRDKSNNEKNIKLFLNSGIHLLKRDFIAYDSINKQINYNFFAFAQEKKKIASYAIKLQTHKKKKAWLAALMSGIIPGSGKIYAGKTGEGIASMLMVSSLGIVTIENYNKAGSKHFKTILFGSIFSIFYVGNIYGSAFSVKLSNEEFNHEMDHKILFNLHIPLRTFFN